jgi:coenzyme F420-0:L-glutamate ligase/coenzyme F420-1:gamma-L-glutamate ligase
LKAGQLLVSGVVGLPEVCPGDDLAGLIATHAELRDGDIVVVAQKVVSKAEGQVRSLADVRPGDLARRYAERLQSDARVVQVILDEAVRVVRDERVLIVETRHGFVCANAGVDHSNVPGEDAVTLLPEDPDLSALRLCERIGQVTGRRIGVIVADTFGRAWRMGITNVALGVAGVPALVDYRGRPDDFGQELTATVVAVADEIACAAELVMGKTDRVPVAVVRGYPPSGAPGPPGSGRELIRPAELDLFR